MQNVIISLDLSTKSTGYCVFDLNGSILTYGVLTPEPYPQHTKDRYPVKSVKFSLSLARQIRVLIENYHPVKILIEEVNSKAGLGSMIGTKSLCGMHFLVLGELLPWIDKVQFVTTSEWRGTLGIKKNNDWKLSTIEYVNRTYSTDFRYKDNDIADAIAVGACYFKKLGGLNSQQPVFKKTKKQLKSKV